MLTRDEESTIRDSVRRSLEHILTETHDSDSPNAAPVAERISEAERIITEETERYYHRLGMVKHTSRSGQVFWVTPAEEERLRGRRSPRRHGIFSRLLKQNPTVVLVWSVTLLVAMLTVAYLVSSESVGGFLPSP